MTGYPHLRQVVLGSTDPRAHAEFYREFFGLRYRPGDEPPAAGLPDERGGDWLVLLNPYGDLYYCENSRAIGNVLTTPAETLYYDSDNLAHREAVKNDVCPTCLSPCQVNVGAMKQLVPYAKFLRRAYKVKRDPARHLETLPTPNP